MPSRSLPATPLTKKRSEHLNLSPPETPIFDTPTPSSPPASATVIVVPQIEVNSLPPDDEINTEEKIPQENKVEAPTIEVVRPDIATASADAAAEVQELLQKRCTQWNKVQEVLQEADSNGLPLDEGMSYDVLPKQDDEVWMQHSSGIEQLRAFLSVCD